MDSMAAKTSLIFTCICWEAPNAHGPRAQQSEGPYDKIQKSNIFLELLVYLLESGFRQL